MTTLQQLKGQLAELRRAQADIAGKLGDVAAERHDIEAEAADRAAAIEAADRALTEALVARELGEQADVEGAQKALDAARLDAQGSSGAATRLRVLDALKARFESEHSALHEQGLGLMKAIKDAEVERLLAMGADLLIETELAMAAVARNAGLLDACKFLAAERGASWPHAVLSETAVAYRSQLTPIQARAQIIDALAA